MQRVVSWAAHAGIRATTAADWPTGDFRVDPRLDFGRVVTRTPGCMLHPTSVDQLAACMQHLAAADIPFTTRGAAHSAGGQVLIDGGAVIDMRGLARVLADDPVAETITVEGGAWWLEVIEHLAPMGRRPPVLTDNPRSTLGGTLAVGGFGDASHRHGLQAEQVRAMTVVTVDGARHAVRPGDPLFDYTLCGRGQLAAIADVTLATVRRPSLLRGRMLGWRTFAGFLEGATRVVEAGHYDFFRARMRYRPGLPVAVVAGDLGDAVTPLDQVGADEATPLEELDLHAVARHDPFEQWNFVSPALELVFPLPAGLATWLRIVDRLTATGLHLHMPRGTSVMVLRPPTHLPLAPFPPCELALLAAIRLELPAADAPRVVPLLQELGREAMAEGARLYLMSIDLAMPNFLERQFGAQLATLRALKQQHDPRRVLNRW